MAARTTFSPVTVTWLIAVGLVAFAGAIYFSVFGGAGAGPTAGANSYSHSAIGHRAFVETLRSLDIPVLVSRNDSTAKADRSTVLVIAEPHGASDSRNTIRELLTAETVLFVLPKWKGVQNDDEPRWLKSATLISPARVESMLRHVAPGATIRRIEAPLSWKPGPFGVAPTLAAPQLMKTTYLKPIVASDRGMLVGELIRGTRRIWVLSDPDLLSNHGLGRGDNAVLAVRLIEGLRRDGGTVIIDETIHGFHREANLWRAIFELPFVATTIIAVVAVAALMWAAVGRFGAPVPVRRPLTAGKTALIDNMAGLLQYGGHGPEIIRRYVSNTLRHVAKRLHAPRKLGEDALIDWVDRVGAARGVSATYRDLRIDAEHLPRAARADSPRLARAARNIYRWKQEMINGS